jgi:hypothetical protein
MYRLFTFAPENDIIKIKYNYSIAHVQGQSLTSADNQFSYVNIPKNASSEFKFIFKDWKKSNYNVDTPPDNKYIVILRDPTERWVSGITEFLIGNYSHPGQLNKELSIDEITTAIESSFVQNLISNFVIFDPHTLPQCYFLQNLNISDIAFFYQDQLVVNRVSKYVGLSGQITNANNTVENEKKTIISTAVKKMISKNTSIQKIIDMHYYCDFRLFDKILFTWNI